jgi:conjugative relaxase-like TrwC/TraI family protein
VSREGVTVIKLQGLTDATGAYFTSDRAPDVAVVTGWRQPGVWLGRGAGAVGLGGGVGEHEFRRVLGGQLPAGTIGPSPRRQRCGLDLIVAAPKPISVLFATSDDDAALAVVNAHLSGVQAALHYLEDRSLAVARTSAGADRRAIRAEGAIAACFTHGTSRSSDPHLHSHVVMANLARGEDGRFGALDQRSLRAHLGAADAIYQGQARYELRERLAVTWELGVDGAIRLHGVTDAECRALSGRSEERRRTPSRGAKRVMDRTALQEVWTQRLRSVPIFDEPTRLHRPPDRVDEHRFASHLHDRSVTPRLVVESFASASVGGVSSSVVADELARLDLPLGWGLEEPQMAASAWLVPSRVLRDLGPRPTRAEPLARWWEERRLRERVRTRRHELHPSIGVTRDLSHGRGLSVR